MLALMIVFALRGGLALASVVLVAACTGERGPQEEVDHVDVGSACVTGEQDAAHTVSVDFGLCLSSSCDELLEASCTTTLDGSTLTVEATATVRSKSGRLVSCTADCGLVTTECQTPPLASGSYTMVYGEESVELTVPGTDETCAGES
jgi:hypothetical protein